MFGVKKTANLSLATKRAIIALSIWTTVPITSAHAGKDVLARIAQCESDGRQFDAKGNVLRNPSNRAVIGIFQINEKLHGAAARRLKLDLQTAAGNRAYAAHLLRTEGTAPWRASRGCWGGAIARN